MSVEKKKWPCLFRKSDTTGEKEIEEFFSEHDKTDMNKFVNIGIIKNKHSVDLKALNNFETSINKLKSNKIWDKKSIVNEFKKIIPNFNYSDKEKYLDGKM